MRAIGRLRSAQTARKHPTRGTPASGIKTEEGVPEEIHAIDAPSASRTLDQAAHTQQRAAHGRCSCPGQRKSRTPRTCRSAPSPNIPACRDARASTDLLQRSSLWSPPKFGQNEAWRTRSEQRLTGSRAPKRRCKCTRSPNAGSNALATSACRHDFPASCFAVTASAIQRQITCA